MTRYTKSFCEEWAFYIKPGKRRRIAYNPMCKKCMHECKQSYRAEIVCCKDYTKKK